MKKINFAFLKYTVQLTRCECNYEDSDVFRAVNQLRTNAKYLKSLQIFFANMIAVKLSSCNCSQQDTRAISRINNELLCLYDNITNFELLKA